MREQFKKIEWEQVDDGFDLRVKNVKAVNIDFLKALLKTVEETKSWGRNFNKDTSREFHRWLRSLDTPLKEQAYARLSNWFLCGREFIKRTELAKATLDFWKALFCTKPDKRLTSTEKDHKILPEEFVLWWPIQLKYQESNETI